VVLGDGAGMVGVRVTTGLGARVARAEPAVQRGEQHTE